MNTRLTWMLLLPALSLGSLAAEDRTRVELTLAPEFSLELEAAWEQLTDTVYKFEKTYPLVQAFEPAMERAEYGADQFRPFLPDGPVEVGEVWQIDARDALPFLKQFHPGATERMHHGRGSGVAAPGAWACLRALGPTHAEVVLRVHADFQLEASDEPNGSSWMTPAQFAGRMLIDRRRNVVTGFELALPDQRANVDLNIASDFGVSADIGRIPRMELKGGVPFPATQVAFAAEVGLEQARSELERRFYPFARLDWLDLEQALARSRETGKPMHIVALFGSLADESC